MKKLLLLLLACFSLYAETWDLDSNGSWNTAGNWSPANVPNSASTDADFGAIITAPRVVTVDGSFTVENLSFNNANSYTLSGGSLTVESQILSTNGAHEIGSSLTINSTGPITNNSSAALTISGPMEVPNSGLSINGSGTVILSGDNNINSAIQVSSGTVQAATNANLGSSNVELSLNNGTLKTTATLTTVREMILTGNGTFDIAFSTLTLPGKVSGNGSLTKEGPGVLILNNSNNDYTGGTIINEGVIGVGADERLGQSSGGITLRGEGSLEIVRSFSSSRSILLDGPGTLSIDPNLTFTLLGNITGSGPLKKLGLGTLVLSGNNSYTGDTSLRVGTVSIGSANNIGNGTLIFDTGTLITTGESITLDNPILMVGPGLLNTDKTLNLQGQITGAGPLTKEGSGTLVVFGNSPFTGSTTVDGGIFSLNGSIDGPVTVSLGGTLSGNATVASLSNSGMTSPGNSIGTITIPGNYTQTATGNLIIEVDQNGNTDLLDITGSADLAGTITLSPLPGLYTGTEFYTFLTAGGGIIGGFDQQVGLDGAKFIIIPFPNELVIGLNFRGAILPVPIDDLKGNAKSVAEYLFCLDTLPDNLDLFSVMQELVNLPPSEFSDALDQLSPAQFGALPLVVLQNSHLISDLFVMNNETTYWCEEECHEKLKVWIAPVGQWQKQDSIGQNIGFNSRTFGFGLGASYLFSSFINFTAGAGYTYTDLGWKKNGGDGHWNSVYLTPSLGFVNKNWFANVLAQGAVNFYHIDRKIHFTGINRTASNQHNSYDILARVDGGYRFSWGDPQKDRRYYTMPIARLSYLNIFEESYVESGAGSINLDVDSQYSAYLQPELLIKNIFEFHSGDFCVAPYSELGWIANIPLTSARYTSSFYKQSLCKSDFTVEGLGETTNQLSVSLGLYITKGCRYTFDISYDGRFFDHIYINAGKLKFDYKF